MVTNKSELKYHLVGFELIWTTPILTIIYVFLFFLLSFFNAVRLRNRQERYEF